MSKKGNVPREAESPPRPRFVVILIIIGIAWSSALFVSIASGFYRPTLIETGVFYLFGGGGGSPIDLVGIPNSPFHFLS